MKSIYKNGAHNNGSVTRAISGSSLDKNLMMLIGALKQSDPSDPNPLLRMLSVLFSFIVIEGWVVRMMRGLIPSESALAWQQIKTLPAISKHVLEGCVDRGLIRTFGSGPNKKYRTIDIIETFCAREELLRKRNKGALEPLVSSLSIVSDTFGELLDEGQTANGPPPPTSGIAARDVAALADLDGCRNCNYRTMRGRVPNNNAMPLYNYLDRAQKKRLQRSLRETGRLPAWMPTRLSTAYSYIPDLNWQNFSRFHQETGLQIRGNPDFLFLMDLEDWVFLCDFKTGTVPEVLSDFYKAQVCLYKWIAEWYGLDVKELGVIFFTPNDKAEAPNLNDSGLNIEFRPTLISVEYDEEIVEMSIKSAAEIMNMDSPPKPKLGCLRCRAIEDFSLWSISN